MTDDKNELLLFQAGNRQFGLSLPIVKSIHGTNVFDEEQPGQEDVAAGIQPFLNQTRIRVPNTEYSIPLYNLSSILAGDPFLCHSGNNPAFESEGESVPAPDISPDQAYPSESGDREKVMLLNVRNHALALKVDRVDGVVSVESSQIEPLSPIFRGPSLDWFPQVLKKDGNLILILNPAGIEGINEEDEEDEDTDLAAGDIQADETTGEKEHCEPADMDPQTGEESDPALVPLSVRPEDIRDHQSSFTGEKEHREPADMESQTGPGEEGDPALAFRPEETREDQSSFPGEYSATSLQNMDADPLEAVGTELDSEISLTLLLTEKADPKKLEGSLTRMIKEESMSDMILQIFTRQLEETVAQEMGKVKKVLLEKLLEKGLVHAEK